MIRKDLKLAKVNSVEDYDKLHEDIINSDKEAIKAIIRGK